MRHRISSIEAGCATLRICEWSSRQTEFTEQYVQRCPAHLLTSLVTLDYLGSPLQADRHQTPTRAQILPREKRVYDQHEVVSSDLLRERFSPKLQTRCPGGGACSYFGGRRLRKIGRPTKTCKCFANLIVDFWTLGLGGLQRFWRCGALVPLQHERNRPSFCNPPT